MRAQTLQIRWHDTLPVFAVDFHPKQADRLATAGGDSVVRV